MAIPWLVEKKIDISRFVARHRRSYQFFFILSRFIDKSNNIFIHRWQKSTKQFFMHFDLSNTHAHPIRCVYFRTLLKHVQLSQCLWNQLFRPICVGAGSRPCPRRSNPRPSRSALLCRPPSTRLTTGKESFRSRRLCCSSRRCLYTPETIWFFPPITSVFRYRLSVTRFCEISRLWQNIISLWQCFDGLFSIWQNCEPTLVNILCFWANIHRCKGPKIERII